MRSWWVAGLLCLIGWVFSAGVSAQTIRDQAMFGTWKVQKDGASLEMYAGNDTGSTVGVMCIEGQSCSVYVATRARCENGRRYQAMVGADDGFEDFTALCRIVGNRFVYVLSDFGRAMRSLRQSQQWGLAVETATGLQSFRFQLVGTHEAIAAMILIDRGSLRPASDESTF